MWINNAFILRLYSTINPLLGFGGNIMELKKSILAVLVALVLLTMGFAGCISEGDEDDWKTPTQAIFDGLSVNETGQMVDVDFSLADKDDRYTKASGTLRVAIWDSDDFQMLDKTFDIKSKDFFSFVILGLTAASYSLEIPFADLAKSHDWGYDGLGEFTERKMHATIWFEYKGETFTDDYNSEFLNPEIPDALLHPNEAPVGDLVVSNPGFVGMMVMCDASASSDAEGGYLDYDWDWGDGDTTPSFLAGDEESHSYDAPGTYTITLTITDPEDATDIMTEDVTVIDILAITVNDWGVVADGDYVGQTYVDLTIHNEDALAATNLPAAAFWLLDATTGREDYNVVEPDVPATLAADGDLTLMVYFDLPDGYTATSIEVFGRVLPLS
jgi:hypothetical protein